MRQYGLFEAFGIELEYMLVDRSTLDVRPLCDVLMQEAAGHITGDFDNGRLAWSNELVNHVVELKTKGPAPSLEGLHQVFHQNVQQINELLSKHNALLLPTGAHPWMNPFTETQLWTHESSEIYKLYNRIFDCRGHGWSNLQSTHINLPFKNEEEFGRLHAAIRLVLPLLPALAASTPILDGRNTGFRDARLEHYRFNQKRLPIIAGSIIPEAVYTQGDYQAQIFDPIRSAIAPYDEEGLLKQYFLNSRGAIARFDRGAIEIRLLDIQESPRADMAIVALVVAVVQALAEGEWATYAAQCKWHEQDLLDLLLKTIREGEEARLSDAAFLRLWHYPGKRATAGELWQHLLERVADRLSAEQVTTLRYQLYHGTLSQRILSQLKGDFRRPALHEVYRRLGDCLQSNTLL